MVADRGKKSKVAERPDEEDSDHIDGDLVLSIEKLQEVQDELEKGFAHISRFLRSAVKGEKEMDLFSRREKEEIHQFLTAICDKIDALYEVQEDLKKVNEEASDKVLEVEQKYNEIRRPVYKKRNEIIKSIPDFWLTAFLSHPALGDLLSEEDQKIFRYFDSLDVEDFKDVKSGYSITFNFKPNPYFEDTKLAKTYTFFDEGTTKITGTTIKWKADMGTANGVNHDKQGNKRPPSEESFFIWFVETQQKDIVEGVHDEVAEIIKEDLWPNPLKYFNNEADEEDTDADEDDDEEKGDDDDDDEDEDEDDDDEDEDGN